MEVNGVELGNPTDNTLREFESYKVQVEKGMSPKIRTHILNIKNPKQRILFALACLSTASKN